MLLGGAGSVLSLREEVGFLTCCSNPSSHYYKRVDFFREKTLQTAGSLMLETHILGKGVVLYFRQENIEKQLEFK